MPDPVKQQQIVQDPNPFSILANDEYREKEDDEAQQVLPDQIENQGAEDAINAKQNDFELNTKDQGAPQQDQRVPQQVQGAGKDHGN